MLNGDSIRLDSADTEFGNRKHSAGGNLGKLLLDVTLLCHSMDSRLVVRASLLFSFFHPYSPITRTTTVYMRAQRDGRP